MPAVCAVFGDIVRIFDISSLEVVASTASQVGTVEEVVRLSDGTFAVVGWDGVQRVNAKAETSWVNLDVDPPSVRYPVVDIGGNIYLSDGGKERVHLDLLTGARTFCHELLEQSGDMITSPSQEHLWSWSFTTYDSGVEGVKETVHYTDPTTCAFDNGGPPDGNFWCIYASDDGFIYISGTGNGDLDIPAGTTRNEFVDGVWQEVWRSAEWERSTPPRGAALVGDSLVYGCYTGSSFQDSERNWVRRRTLDGVLVWGTQVGTDTSATCGGVVVTSRGVLAPFPDYLALLDPDTGDVLYYDDLNFQNRTLVHPYVTNDRYLFYLSSYRLHRYDFSNGEIASSEEFGDHRVSLAVEGELYVPPEREIGGRPRSRLVRFE